MSDSWDDYASDWDNNPEVILYAQKAFESLPDSIELSGLRVLDFGCGTGQLSQRLAPLVKDLVALDPAQKMIQVLDAKHIQNISTLAIQLDKHSLKENIQLQEKFDLIVASSVCTFLEDYPASLKFIKRLLADKGTFIQWDWLASDEKPDFGFSQDFVSNTLKQAGFNTVSTCQAFSLNGAKGNMKVLMAQASL